MDKEKNMRTLTEIEELIHGIWKLSNWSKTCVHTHTRTRNRLIILNFKIVQQFGGSVNELTAAM